MSYKYQRSAFSIKKYLRKDHLKILKLGINGAVHLKDLYKLVSVGLRNLHEMLYEKSSQI
jgi:hypothetical protein